MSLKIPEAPNIVGSDPVLRSPQTIAPVQENPKFSVDLSALKDSIGDIGKYYTDKVQQEERTLVTAGKNNYIEHMTGFINETYQSHKGQDARDLYAQYIKPESDKWLDDYFGEPKDDGKLRMADPALKEQFRLWVATQQPSYINSAAQYEQREWDKYSDSVHKSQDNLAATMIINAESQETIQNGINLFTQNTYDDNPGLDDNYIKQAIAAKVDTSLLANINRLVSNDKPEKAWNRLKDPIFVNGMTESSKKEALEAIRKSYINVASTQIAQYKADNGGGVEGEDMMNRLLIKQIFEPKTELELNTIESEIRSKADEKYSAWLKADKDARSKEMTLATNQFAQATTPEERQMALQNIAILNPDAGTALANAQNSLNAQQNDMDTLGELLPSAVAGITEELKQATLTEAEQADEFRAQTVAGALGITEENKMKLGGAGFENEFDITVPRGELESKWFDRVTDQKISAAVDNMVSQGRLTPEQGAAAARVIKTTEKRKRDMSTYKDLTTRISSGEIQSYDPVTMGNLDPSIQMQLIEQLRVQSDYNQTVDKLRTVGVNLDSLITNSGADAQYKNLDLNSQNIFKRSVVHEIKSYADTHQGSLPTSDKINGIILRLQKDSLSPAMMALQDSALAENLSAENLTDTQRYNVAIYEAVTPVYNKPAARGLKDQMARLEKTIDTLSHSGMLTVAEKEYIKANKEYLASLLQAGDVKTMGMFIGLAKQGGF